MTRGSPGFTLVEVVAAMAILAVVSAVGMSVARSAVSGISTGVNEARWIATMLRFDRTVRGAIAAHPTTYWAPPPRIERREGEVSIDFGPDGEDDAVRFSQRGELLVVIAETGTAVFRGVSAFSLTEISSPDGRVAGVRIKLSSAHRSQDFLIAWRGQPL